MKDFNLNEVNRCNQKNESSGPHPYSVKDKRKKILLKCDRKHEENILEYPILKT